MKHDRHQQNPRTLRGFLCINVILLAQSAAAGAPRDLPPSPSTTQASPAPTLAEQRREFQIQELATARSFSFIFSPGDAPRIVWRDVETVKKLGGDLSLRVRWFDADLREAKIPDHPGRWGASIESTAPNGTPVRRAMTFYARPSNFLLYFTQGTTSAAMPPMPGPIPAEVWKEHESEIRPVADEGAFQKLNDSEPGAIVIAGLSEMKPTSRPALSIESAAVRNDDFHLALKLKVLGLDKNVRPLQPPAKAQTPSPILHDGDMRSAGMRDDAKKRIEDLCRAWADDSGEPFVTVVARHGVIVTHEAFGRDKTGKPIDRNYRGDVASITKTITALLFARFHDQGLLDLEEPVGSALPDWPRDPKHVPTFRQCLMHMSGVIGHGEFGGTHNPYLDNFILNGIDANVPGKTYTYAGTNFDLVAKAMEIVTGRSLTRLYDQGLFQPLGIGDVPIAGAASGAQPTALQLATLAQLLANHGTYGDKQLFSEQTSQKLMPEDLNKRYPAVHEIEGIGMHWMHQPKPGAKPESTRDEDLILGPRVLGHGSLTMCMFLVDLDHDLIITQIRHGGGERFGEWTAKFFQTIADAIIQ